MLSRRRSAIIDMGQVSNCSLKFDSYQLTVTSLEINFATMAACIPTLGCLFRSFNGSKNVISRSSAPNYKKQSEAVQSGLFLSKQNPENYGQYVLASHGQFLLTSNGSFLNSARSEKNTLAFKHVNASGEFKNRIGMA